MDRVGPHLPITIGTWASGTSLLLAFPTQRDRVSHCHTQELDRKANKHLLQTALQLLHNRNRQQIRKMAATSHSFFGRWLRSAPYHTGLKVILQLTFFRQLLICMTLDAWPFSGRQPQL